METAHRSKKFFTLLRSCCPSLLPLPLPLDRDGSPQVQARPRPEAKGHQAAGDHVQLPLLQPREVLRGQMEKARNTRRIQCNVCLEDFQVRRGKRKRVLGESSHTIRLLLRPPSTSCRSPSTSTSGLTPARPPTREQESFLVEEGPRTLPMGVSAQQEEIHTSVFVLRTILINMD